MMIVSRVPHQHPLLELAGRAHLPGVLEDQAARGDGLPGPHAPPLLLGHEPFQAGGVLALLDLLVAASVPKDTEVLCDPLLY